MNWLSVSASLFIKVMPKYAKVNALMLKCFKMIFQRLEVWRYFFSYEHISIEAINWFIFIKWVISTAPRHAYSTLRQHFKVLKYLNEVPLDNISKIWDMEMLFFIWICIHRSNKVSFIKCVFPTAPRHVYSTLK